MAPVSFRPLARLSSVVTQGSAYVRSFYGRDGTLTSYFDSITQLFVAAGRPMVRRLLREVEADPERAPVLARRDDLVPVLDDLDALARLPPDSFGGAYFRHRQSPRVLSTEEFVDRVGVAEYGRRNGWSDDVIWMGERIVIEHDLIHIITGYPTSMAGEQYTNTFMVPHLAGAAAMVVALIPATHRRLPVPRRPWIRELTRAYLRGREATPLVAHDWAAELERPLAEVVSRLGIPSLERCHPDGLLDFDYVAFWPESAAELEPVRLISA